MIGKLLLFVLLLASPTFTEAQTSLFGSQNNQTTQLAISPNFPAPGDSIATSISTYTINTNGAAITWYIDDVEMPDFTNLRSITTTAGDIGEQSTIKAVLILPNGNTLTATRTYTVSDIDIIIDANTQTPKFYLGRPLPSIGSEVQAIALPRLGNNLAPDNYSYTWKIDGNIIDGGGRIGAYVQIFTMSKGGGTTVGVDVSDSGGRVVASKSIVVPNTRPEMHFYVDNPLRGLSRLSFGDTYNLIGTEATVRAEPYFIGKNIPQQNLHTEWSVNNRLIENPSDDIQNITLQKTTGSGNFNVSFHIRNLKALLQGVEEDFNLVF